MGHFSMEKSLNPGSDLGGNQQPIAQTRVWRERAEGLLGSERDLVGHHAGIGSDLPTMAVWPNWRDEDGLRVVGWCPCCGGHHQFGLSTNPVRYADCMNGGRSLRLIVRDEPMPIDLAFSIKAEADDLRGAALLVERRLSYFERIHSLVQARKQVGRRSEVSRDMLALAVQVLIDSGALGETLGRATANGADDFSTIFDFVEQQAGDTFGRRLHAALKRAELAIATGELL